MGAFTSIRTYNIKLDKVGPVAQALMDKYRKEGYEVTGEENVTGGWTISIRKGNIFKNVLGLKTALNIEIIPSYSGIEAKAGVGIFGMQAVPTAIMMFVAWPVLITQIWGLIQQSKLDEEALDFIGQSLKTTEFQSQTTGAAGQFCTACGARLAAGARFCHACGSSVGA